MESIVYIAVLLIIVFYFLKKSKNTVFSQDEHYLNVLENDMYTLLVLKGRTKALTMVENSDFVKAEQITLMMENVPETLTMQDAEILTNQMLAI